MTREQADAERERLADEHPEASWIVGQAEDGWRVLKVAITPPVGATETSTETRPKPPSAEDPRPAGRQLVPPWSAAGS